MIITTSIRRTSRDFKALEWFIQNFLNFKKTRSVSLRELHRCGILGAGQSVYTLDVRDAISEENSRRIFCSRNKYGASHLLNFNLPDNYITYIDEKYGKMKPERSGVLLKQ